MASPRCSVYPGLILGSSLLAMMASGCARVTAHHNIARGSAPTLSEDAPHGRGGTNPNAPFVLVDRTPRTAAHLASMSAQDAAPCSARQISLSEVAAEMNGASRLVKFAFVNESSETCRIGGYPGIVLLDAQDLPLANLTVVKSGPGTLEAHTVSASASIEPAGEAEELVLDPKQEAYFGITWTTGEDCPVVSRIELTAPGTAQTFTIRRPLTVCAGQVRVTALQSTQDAS